MHAQSDQIEAVFELFAEIRRSEEALRDALTPGGDQGDPTRVLHYWCGGERVDDVLFGGISNGPDGAYAEYVDTIGSVIGTGAQVVAPLSDYLISRDSLAAGLAESGLGGQPSTDMMPVFYFCRRGEGGVLELADPAFAPSLAWATTIGDHYDLVAARVDTSETLRTLLDGNLPQMQTIPPIERGYTVVKLPMWLWLENLEDLMSFRIDAISEEGSVRLSTRATLVEVTWELGDATINCGVTEMRPFIHGQDSIADPTPVCSHMFTEVVDYQMSATARYYIEEQLSFRGSDQYDWPDAAWTEHPTNAYATVTNQTETMTVREFVSVNVPLDYESSSELDD